MRRFVLGSCLALAFAGCGTNNSLDLATPTPDESPTPTPTATPVDACAVAGNVCAIGPSDDGDGDAALSASLSSPYDTARDAAGNVYIAETFAHRIRKIDPSGVITTIAGVGEYRWPVVTGMPGEQTPVLSPTMIAASLDGWVYWAGWDEPLIYGRDPATGLVVLVAGDGTWDPGADGPALEVPAYLDWQGEIAVDANGNLFLADFDDHVVRVLNRQATDIVVAGVTIAPGQIETIAGTGNPGGGANGVQARASALDSPSDVVPMADGSVLIADSENHRIRRVATNGIVTTIAGTGALGSGGDGGAATAATFNRPGGLAADAAGRVFVTDNSLRVRLLNLTGATAVWGGVSIGNGNVDTVAGDGSWAWYIHDDGGPALDQSFAWEKGRAVIASDGDLVLSDTWTSTIKRIDSASGVMAVIAGFAGHTTNADYQPWVDDPVFLPTGELVYHGGTPYFFGIDPVTGERSRIAGDGSTTLAGDGGPAIDASAVADSLAVVGGSIVFTDTWNLVIRQIDASGIITTIAGSGAQVDGGSGDGGLATAAAFDRVEAVTADANGNLFVLDDDQIRVINRTGATITVAGVMIAAGEIETIAGSNAPGFFGDGGSALTAELDTDYQTHLLVANGSLYFSDFRNHRIRRIDLATGIITTFAGSGEAGFRGDGDLPENAWVGFPTGLAARDGYLYWAQEGGAAIRRALLTGDGPVETIAGSGVEGYAESGVSARETSFLWPSGIAFDANGDLVFGDGSKRLFRLVMP